MANPIDYDTRDDCTRFRKLGALLHLIPDYSPSTILRNNTQIEHSQRCFDKSLIVAYVSAGLV